MTGKSETRPKKRLKMRVVVLTKMGILLFSWGEVQEKDDYSKSCYKMISQSVIIGTTHDAATVSLGREWSLPTQVQFDELIHYCKWEWRTNGVMIIGVNGNTMFLPASGWYCSSGIEYRGRYGYYWTGDVYNDSFAKGLLFSKTEHKTGNGYRYYGRSIRAVKRNGQEKE